jgi:hypothetical protein
MEVIISTGPDFSRPDAGLYHYPKLATPLKDLLNACAAVRKGNPRWRENPWKARCCLRRGARDGASSLFPYAPFDAKISPD